MCVEDDYEDVQESEWDIAEAALQQRERYMQEAAISDRSNGTAHSSSSNVAEETSQEFRASDSNGAAVAQESAGLKDSDPSAAIDLSEDRSVQSGMQDSPANGSMTGSESDRRTVGDSKATSLQEHQASDAFLLRVDDTEEKEIRNHASLENPITETSGFEEQERSDEEGSNEGNDAVQDWWEEWDEGERPPGPMTKREYERQLRRQNLAERDLQKEEKTMVRQELVEHRKAQKEADGIDRRSQKVAKMQSRREQDEVEKKERKGVDSAEKLARKGTALKGKMLKRDVKAVKKLANKVKEDINSAQPVQLGLLALSSHDRIAEADTDVCRPDKTEEEKNGTETSKPSSEEAEEEEVHRRAPHTGSTTDGNVGVEADELNGVEGQSSESQAAVGESVGGTSAPIPRQKQLAPTEVLAAALTAGTVVTELGAVVAAKEEEIRNSGGIISLATIVALDSTDAAVPASEPETSKGPAAEEGEVRGPVVASVLGSVTGKVEEVPPPPVKETSRKVTAGVSSVGGVVVLAFPEEGKTLAERVSEGMSQMADSVSDSVGLVTSTLSKTVALVTGTMQDTVSDLTYTVQEMSCTVQDTVQDLSESVQESVQGLSDSVSDTVADITESFEDAVTEAQDSMKETVCEVTDKVSETVQELTGSREYDDDEEENEIEAFKPPDTPEFKGIKGLDNFVVKQVRGTHLLTSYPCSQPLYPPTFSPLHSPKKESEGHRPGC